MDYGARDGERVHDVVGTILSVATQRRTIECINAKRNRVIKNSTAGPGFQQRGSQAEKRY